MGSRGGLILLFGLALLVSSTCAHTQEEMEAWFVLLVKSSCDTHIPGFSEETSDGYTSWRSFNADAIARVEKNPGFQAQVDEMVKAAQKQDDHLDSIVDECASLKAMFDALSRPVDSRMASPEETWLMFVGGLKTGDRDLVRKCLTSPDSTGMEHLLNTWTDEQLQEFANVFGELVVLHEYEGFAEARVRMGSSGMSTVSFFRNINGEWVIAAM